MFNSRLRWVKRGVKAGKKLDAGKQITASECQDALSWDKYCTGGETKWMLERWQAYDRANLLPPGEWLTLIKPYTPQPWDDSRMMLK